MDHHHLISSMITISMPIQMLILQIMRLMKFLRILIISQTRTTAPPQRGPTLCTRSGGRFTMATPQSSWETILWTCRCCLMRSTTWAMRSFFSKRHPSWRRRRRLRIWISPPKLRFCSSPAGRCRSHRCGSGISVAMEVCIPSTSTPTLASAPTSPPPRFSTAEMSPARYTSLWIFSKFVLNISSYPLAFSSFSLDGCRRSCEFIGCVILICTELWRFVDSFSPSNFAGIHVKKQLIFFSGWFSMILWK